MGNDEIKPCEAEYWLWLQGVLGAGAATDEYLAYFGNAEQAWSAGVNEWRLSGIVTPAKLKAMSEKTPADYRGLLEECRSKGVTVITPGMSQYPKQLLFLRRAPLALFVRGDAGALLDPVPFAIVGTREAGDYGRDVTQRISYTLAHAGMTVVSGAALGVDSEAHAGAMLAKGRTVAFLGCGLDTDYLRENAPLRRAIARYGAVVSEYGLHGRADRSTFPIRNRLIAGLSLGTLVIEAGLRSGAMITANLTAEQGKDLYAISGDILRSSFEGTKNLIREGAKPVFSARDVLEDYAYIYADYLRTDGVEALFDSYQYVDYRHYAGKKKPPAPEKKHFEPARDTGAQTPPGIAIPEKRELPAYADENARIVYERFSSGGEHADSLAEKTGLPVPAILAALTELEIYGVIRAKQGGSYVII